MVVYGANCIAPNVLEDARGLGESDPQKYKGRLTEEEFRICDATADKIKGSSHKARRAGILLKVEADWPG